MNGIAQAADFSSAAAIYTIIAPKFSSFAQLLVAYKDHAEVRTCILKLYSSIAENVSAPDIPGDYYGQFNVMLEEFGKILQGGGIRGEELTDALFILFDILEGLISNTIDTNASSAAVFSGMNLVLEQLRIAPDMMIDLKFGGVFMKLVSLIVTFFPASGFPPVLLDGLVQGLLFGIGHGSFEVAGRGFEGVCAFGKGCWQNGVGSEALTGHLDTLLRRVLDIILLQDFESGLFGTAGTALFYLLVLRENTYVEWVSALGGLQSEENRGRLEAAVGRLNEGVRAGVTSGGMGVYKKGFGGFVLCRGFLRIK
jgi:hypothetical protein